MNLSNKQDVLYTADSENGGIKRVHEIDTSNCDVQETAESILQEAQRLTSGDRQESYGHPYDDYQRTAALWTVLLAAKLAPGEVIEWHDAIRCMCAVKLSRDVNSMARDNMTDLAGYARCRQEGLEEERRRIDKSKLMYEDPPIG